MKRKQYRRTRQIDIFGARLTRALIDRLFLTMPTTPGGTRGLLSTLWIDGALAAGHFGLLGDATLHYWFPVYDDRFANLSPAIALLHEIAKGSSLLDIQRIDLGDGGYRFKREFANRHLPLIAGTARVSNGGNRMRLSSRHTSAVGVSPPASLLLRIPHAVTRRVELLASLHSASSARPSGIQGIAVGLTRVSEDKDAFGHTESPYARRECSRLPEGIATRPQRGGGVSGPQSTPGRRIKGADANLHHIYQSAEFIRSVHRML
ncbi:hypothetical protein KOAAANKH_02079 [Brevundimonas sp. NIBR10]|nr:hypothetical protein KOAAANKH_02079 [Brevundimonas sp. NIBR10]